MANSDSTIPPWAERDLLDSAGKKEKGQQIIIGAMYHGAYEHTAYKAGGNEKGQLRVADRRGHHVGEVHDCQQQPCGLEVRRPEMAKSHHENRPRWIHFRRLHLPWT